jgi:hypothetical protein
MRLLERQSAVESVRFVGGRRVSALCTNVLMAPLQGAPPSRPASLLVTGKSRLIETRFASYQIGRTVKEVDGPLPAIEATLAGCPRALGRRIGRLLDRRIPVRASSMRLDGQRVWRLSFTRASGGLELVVLARGSAPVAVRLLRRGRREWTRLAPAEPRDLRNSLLRLDLISPLVRKETA